MRWMYRVKRIDLEAGKKISVLHEKDAEALGVREQDRVKIVAGEKCEVTIVETTHTLVKRGEVGLLLDCADLIDEEEVDVVPTGRPASVESIKKKMNGGELTKGEIKELVQDIVERNLTDIELAAYVCAVYMRGMNMREVTDLTIAMAESGTIIEVDRKPVYDFHSIGGVPGNKVTLLVVPIVAAAGLTIPKTSSRAISSPCGTADIFEVLAPVSLTAQDIKRIAEEVGGTIAWGGGVNLAPADDIIIRAEYPLSLDPHAQLLASVMAKKKAVNADYVLIDIPVGREAKVEEMQRAKQYARDFIELGERLGINVECAITYGGQPVGRAIGPALEVREALSALENKNSPASLIEKATHLAGILLEMGGIRNGAEEAEAIIRSGKALRKLREIIQAQGGNPDVHSDDIDVGRYKAEIKAKTEGYVKRISNRTIGRIAREAGSPYDKGAGILLAKKEGLQVEIGETLLTIFADNKRKLERAERLAKHLHPITIEGMILERIPKYHTM